MRPGWGKNVLKPLPSGPHQGSHHRVTSKGFDSDESHVLQKMKGTMPFFTESGHQYKTGVENKAKGKGNRASMTIRDFLTRPMLKEL